ncbi:hypothetical protein CAN33_0011610 [Aspergillus niger]|uniref:chitinase n=2 Tax=Aspergillus niger TaxID=5061 RepID=A0A505I1K0_ASPNG|nr:hypothetical protein CAN33_0011610 [Aspergillus niger]
MALRTGTGLLALSFVFLAIFCNISTVLAQSCSASNPCATGCCSKYGYCGTGEDHCGADCIANCDYEATTECSAIKPCAEGCCSKFGVCGYGPDYCGKENCVANCERTSECDPGNWGLEYSSSSTCPLNVCCSKYGFCGTTEEFCGDKKVKRPSCVPSQRLRRVVGYYEGWATTRPCKAFWPEQIPKGVYTHLNYAFATIDPITFEVLPPTALEAKLMTRLTSLKDHDPGLRVNIAIGGWSFNDPGTTASVFTRLAASEDNQMKFFRSLASFMATYNFDGVDIDWEYPVDSDRSGQKEDFQNFPKFISNLKNALKGTGGRDELSLTLPTSYWYLRNFDIKALAKSVDYFNYMSYDLHGTWDKGNKWTGEYLDAHTNLTEITDSLDLLWRNDISPDKVVMGVAFYSRAFTVEDTKCMDPGCRFVSGSDPGECSRQTGILMNSELDDIRANKSLTPSLDKEAAVQILKWGNQWASYDDKTTFKLRIDFAKKTCLGGIMVWAVSHDTYDGAYSSALASISPQTKPIKKLQVSPDGLTVTRDERIRQCKWTSCGQTCPSDYVAISRSDPKYRKGELMLDSIRCPKGASHTLCCPKEDVPKCGWYTHNNGNCSPDCPSGYFEIGSISSNGLCHHDYEAACCESNKDSTGLYNTLQWSEAPMCDWGECPVVDDKKSTTLALATAGSGDAVCNVRSFSWDDGIAVQERKLCYDSTQDKKTWDNCDWYDSVDSPPKGKPDDYCVDSCPSDMVRLATYRYDKNCAGGVRAFCCTDNYYSSKSQTNPEMAGFRSSLNNYLEDGTCSMGESASLSRRDLFGRDTNKYEDLQFLIPLLYTLLVKDDTDLNAKEKLEAGYWDDWAKSNSLTGLVLSTLRSSSDEDDGTLDKRMLSAPSHGTLEKRAAPKTYKVWCAGTGDWVDGLKIKPVYYPSAGRWQPTDVQYKEARTYQSRTDCANPLVDPMEKDGNNYDTEHVLELQMVPMFFRFATTGELTSGRTASFQPIDCTFFLPTSQGGIDFLHQSVMPKAEIYPGDPYEDRRAKSPEFRIMAALGTSKNKENFYLLEKAVNGMKARIFRNVDLVDQTKWAGFIEDTSNPGIPLKEIKAAIAVWHYLNDQDVKNSFVELVSHLREVWVEVDSRFNNNQPLFLPAWDEWWHDYIEYQVERTSTWITNGIAAMRKVWSDENHDNDPAKLIVLAALTELEAFEVEIVRYNHLIFP